MATKRFTITLRFDDINDGESIKYFESLSPKDRNTFIYRLVKKAIENCSESPVDDIKLAALQNELVQLTLKVEENTQDIAILKNKACIKGNDIENINISQQHTTTEDLFANVEIFH